MAMVDGDYGRADDEEEREDEDEEDGDDPIMCYEKMREEIQRERMRASVNWKERHAERHQGMAADPEIA